MKFAAGLIKIFSGILSAFVFGAFLYYTYQYQITKDADNLFTANLALAVFLISSVTFALLFVLFDVYQNKNTESELAKLLKGADLTKNSENSNITDLLVKIASFNNQTNQLLDHRLTEINTGLSSLNNSSEVNSTNFQSSLEQLTAICGEISQYVDNIKNENTKENQRNAGHNGNFDVLVATVSRLSSDLNDLNGRLLDVVNQISKNVTTSIQSHTDIDNEIKDLLKEILMAKNGETTASALPVSEPAADVAAVEYEDKDEPAPQSVADFYKERFKDIKENQEEQTEAAPEEVTEDTEILQGNEQRIDNLLNTPEQTETFAPQPLDLTEPQEDAQAEKQAADETTEIEEKEPWNAPLDKEISAAEQEYMPQPAEDNDSASEQNSFAEPIVNNFDNADEPVFSNTPVTDETIDTPLDFDVNTDISDSFELPTESETPASSAQPNYFAESKTEPYFEQPVAAVASEPAPASDFSLAASDPFNPSPEHFEDLKQAAQTSDADSVSLDLQDEKPVSMDLPNEESNVKLDDIFNDDFANEMANLDILKDDNNNKNTGEISVEDLLADDNDPYNPNK